MVEVFDLHQAEDKTYSYFARTGRFLRKYVAGWSSGSSSGS
jgi:hypothetical protein